MRPALLRLLAFAGAAAMQLHVAYPHAFVYGAMRNEPLLLRLGWVVSLCLPAMAGTFLAMMAFLRRVPPLAGVEWQFAAASSGIGFAALAPQFLHGFEVVLLFGCFVQGTALALAWNAIQRESAMKGSNEGVRFIQNEGVKRSGMKG